MADTFVTFYCHLHLKEHLAQGLVLLKTSTTVTLPWLASCPAENKKFAFYFEGHNSGHSFLVDFNIFDANTKCPDLSLPGST